MTSSRENRPAALILVLLLLAVLPARSAEPAISVSVSVDKPEITIGEVVKLTFTVKYSDGVELVIPSIGEKLGEFFIRDISYPEPRKENGKNVQDITFDITTYLTGDLSIPPVDLHYNFKDENGKEVDKVFETDEIVVHVKRTAPKDAEDIRDIKGPVEVPFDWGPVLLWGGVGLATLTLIIAGIVYLKRRSSPEYAASKLPPPGPPHETALAELDRIEAMGLVEAGEFEKYYDLVTDTLRRYLGDRYSFNALELTTNEIVAALDGRLRRLEVKDPVVGMLRESDMIKFARGDTTPDRARRLMAGTREVIHQTKPRAEGSPGGM